MNGAATQRSGALFRRLSLLTLILAAVAPRWSQAEEPSTKQTGGQEEIAMGSLVSFGKTPVGRIVSRKFQMTNTDKTRPMRLTDLQMTEDPNQQEWFVRFGTREWIAPGDSVVVTIDFFAIRQGVHQNGVSWTVERQPALENEEGMFTFDVVGEAVADAVPPRP